MYSCPPSFILPGISSTWQKASPRTSEVSIRARKRSATIMRPSSAHARTWLQPNPGDNWYAPCSDRARIRFQRKPLGRAIFQSRSEGGSNMEMRDTDRPGDEGLARALGWFSIGLGVAELVAPRGIARMIGVRDHRILLRAVGLREMASGVGILTQRRPAGWLWARVVGDVMDLALVGAAFRSPRARRGRLALATAAVAGVTALDVVASRRLSRRPGEPEDDATRIAMSITINRSPEEIYRFWRDFRNL